jgi:hypothetical protein
MAQKILLAQKLPPNPEDEYVKIPTFVFKDRSVAVFESLVEYLKDHKGLTFHEIAVMLNRNDRTIWTVYKRSKIKRKKHER